MRVEVVVVNGVVSIVTTTTGGAAVIVVPNFTIEVAAVVGLSELGTVMVLTLVVTS